MTLNDKKLLLSSLKDLEKSARKQLQNITQIINKYESEINAEELKRKNAPKEFKYPEETSLFLHNRKPIRGIRYNGDNINDIITFMGLYEADHTINVYNQIHLIYDNNCYALFMDRKKSIDVDCEDDLDLVEFMLTRRNHT